MKCKCKKINLKRESLKEFIKQKEKEGFVLLFVWGTLQIGEPNHRLIEFSRPSYYLGRFRTTKKFCRTGFITTYNCDNKEQCDLLGGSFTEIEGDLFLIKRDVFRTHIDRLEGYIDEKNYIYNRKKVKVTNSEIVLEAWMYFFDCVFHK